MVRLVQVSDVSCVSHDAVPLIPGPRVLPVSRATTKFLNASSVPVFGLFSLSLRHFLSPQCARGFVSDLPDQIPLSHAMSSWSLFPDDNPRCTGAKISANGNNLMRVITVTRCPERCDATRSTCVSRDTKSRISNHRWTDIATWRN